MAHDTNPASQRAELFPLDFDALEKGSWLEPDVIERAGNEGFISRDSAGYRFRVMKLMSQIYDRCGIQCRDDHNRIRLMTDDEALAYRKRRAVQLASGVVRNAKSMMDIDRNLLTDDARRAELDHAVVHGAAMASAVRSEARKLSGWRALRADNKDSEGHGSAALGAERKG